MVAHELEKIKSPIPRKHIHATDTTETKSCCCPLTSPTHLPAASSARQTDRLSLWRNLPRASPAEPGFRTAQDQEKETSGSECHERLYKTITEEPPLECVGPPDTLSPRAIEYHGHGWARGRRDAGLLQVTSGQIHTVPWPRMVRVRGKAERGEGMTLPSQGCSCPAARRGDSKRPSPNTHYSVTELERRQLENKADLRGWGKAWW